MSQQVKMLASKWADRALVFGAIMGAFIAGFSGRAGAPGLSLDEPVRLVVGLMVSLACGFALVERVVATEVQCANTAAQVDALRRIILNLAIKDGVKVDPDIILDPTGEHPVEVSVR